jgi:D-alanyl-D-alanine carboxypeptidase (penicillin-binding protein 5/6)
MSFFREAKLLWIYVLVLCGLTTLICQIEQREKQTETVIYTYSLETENDTVGTSSLEIENDTVETATSVDSLSTLQAKYALLMDSDNRRVLYEKNGYEQAPMASTTKIMTLLVALEQGNPEDVVVVSEYAASMPKVHLGMVKDEQYRLGDLYYSLMLESHNDTAVAIAEHIGGSVEGFAALMNEKAAELGAYNTHFVTPNGLDDEEHYTTAYDLALIASYAVENEEFLKIVQTSSYTFYEQSKGRSFTVNNKDRFLTSYDGAIGIKTGFTGNAGYCFVGAAKRGGKNLVSVVLACGWPPNKTYKWKDTTALMNYGMDNYEIKEILAKGTTFQKIEVTDSIEGEPVTPYAEESVSLLLRGDEKVSFEVELPKSVEAPVKQQQTLGKLVIKIDGDVYKQVPLYSAEKRTKITFIYILKQVLQSYFMGQNGCFFNTNMIN